MDIQYEWNTIKRFGVALLFAGAAKYYLDVGCRIVSSLHEERRSSPLESLLQATPSDSQQSLDAVPAVPYSDWPKNISDTRQYPYVLAQPDNDAGAP